jgi:hypothetical protein
MDLHSRSAEVSSWRMLSVSVYVTANRTVVFDSYKDELGDDALTVMATMTAW